MNIDINQIAQAKFPYALVLTGGNYHDAKDLTQEAVIKTLKSISRMDNRQQVEAYFAQALRCALIDGTRRRRSRGEHKRPSLSVLNIEHFEAQGEYDDTVDRECIRLRAMIDQLPPAQREVIVLYVYKDMMFKEIAAATGQSINTALGRVRYGIINLKKMAAGLREL